MMTVKEVSRLTGVSVRTLQYYDKIGLLPPTQYTDAGYRLYDDTALVRLQQILLFRELEFPLRDIREILSRPDFNREQALAQQIELLERKRARLERLIVFARGLEKKGDNAMDFSVFDKATQAEYAKQAKAQWGDTEAYRVFAEKSSRRSAEAEAALGRGLMSVFAEFGTIKALAPDNTAVQSLVKKLQDYITANYYTCTAQILEGLGNLYAAGGAFTENIDAAGGTGTAQFVRDAIAVYLSASPDK